eukprot:6186681-Pleurochrysis_carterae.AAC.1
MRMKRTRARALHRLNVPRRLVGRRRRQLRASHAAAAAAADARYAARAPPSRVEKAGARLPQRLRLGQHADGGSAQRRRRRQRQRRVRQRQRAHVLQTATHARTHATALANARLYKRESQYTG